MRVFGSVSWSALCVHKESKFRWQKSPSTSPTQSPLPLPSPLPPLLRLQLGTHPTSRTKISQLFSLIFFITFLTIWPISRHFNFVFWSPLWNPRTGNLGPIQKKKSQSSPASEEFLARLKLCYSKARRRPLDRLTEENIITVDNQTKNLQRQPIYRHTSLELAGPDRCFLTWYLISFRLWS